MSFRIGTKMFQEKKAYSKDKKQIVNFPNTHFVASNMGGRVQYQESEFNA